MKPYQPKSAAPNKKPNLPYTKAETSIRPHQDTDSSDPQPSQKASTVTPATPQINMTYPTTAVLATSDAMHYSKFTMNRFEELVKSLKDALGESSGLTSEDVDVDVLTQWMERYLSNEKEWGMYAMSDSSRGYTRNLVDEGNGKSNLLVLVWTPGKGSPIHDHGNAHCLMKILRGRLTETRYDFPGKDGNKPMRVKSEKIHEENAVAYMADELGVHRVSNQGSDFAVSLHLYTPPNVARGGCYVFDQKTGKRSHVPKCGYFSAYGRRLRE